MVKTIFWLIWLFVFLIRYTPFLIKAKRLHKKGKLEEQEAYVAKKADKWARLLLKHVKTNVIIEGKENLPSRGEPVVFICNHQSYIDIPVMFIAMGYPWPFVAKKEIEKVPVLKTWMNLLGCLFLDREDVRSAGKLMREVDKRLKDGKSIVICPEGTRSKSYKVGEFKSGAVHMAIKSKVPIIPVAIDGTYKVLEGNNYKLQAADVKVKILPRVIIENMPKAEQKELPAKLEGMIREEVYKGHCEEEKMLEASSL